MTERSKAGMLAKAERGILPGCAPLGYRNAIVDGERVIVPDPETAPKVRRLFELASRKKMSLRKLAAEAERIGLRSRNGKPFGPSAMKAVLENPFYIGIVRFNKILIRGQHKALVDENAFMPGAKAIRFLRGDGAPNVADKFLTSTCSGSADITQP